MPNPPTGNPLSDGERVAYVEVGEGAVMTVVNPRGYENGGIEWRLRYGNPAQVRFEAASVIASYDYLLSDFISTKEAIRRLRLMRHARAALSPSHRGT